MNVPTLIVHGDDDQILPIAAAALRSAKIAPQAILKAYPGATHACPPPTRISSTPTYWHSSGPEHNQEQLGCGVTKGSSTSPSSGWFSMNATFRAAPLFEMKETII